MPAVSPLQDCVSHNASGCDEQSGDDVGEEGGGEQTADESEEIQTCTEAAEEENPLPEPNDTPQEEDTCCDVSAGSRDIPDHEQFNSFHYWRTPIPELDLNLLEEEITPSTPNTNTAPTLDRKHLEELIENLEPHIDDPDVKGQTVIVIITTTQDQY